MHLRATIGSLLLGLACSVSSPKPDWQIYGEIIERSPAVEADLARCRALADPTLAGDCALTVTIRLSEQTKTSLHTRCAQIPSGVWQEECAFVAAERARSAGKLTLAIKQCEKSGQFAPDCAFHLWQRAMRTLAQRIVLERMADQQTQMRSLHKRWSERVGHFSNFDAIYWRKLFRAVWDGVYRVDPGICNVLDSDLAEHCRFGARIHLDHAIRASLREADWTADFCALKTPSVSTLEYLPGGFPELDRFPDHPAHQRVVDDFHHAKCSGGTMPAHPDPPRRKMTRRELAAPQTQELAAPQTQERTAPPTQSK